MPVFNTGIKQLHKIGGGLLVMKITLKTSRTFTEVRAASILISGLKKKMNRFTNMQNKHQTQESTRQSVMSAHTNTYTHGAHSMRTRWATC